MKTINFKYEDQVSERLDKIITKHFLERIADHPFTRSKIQALVKSGGVKVNLKIVFKPSAIIESGSEIDVTIQEAESLDIKPYDYQLNILFEDEYLLVIDKKNGISMHPGAGEKDQTILNALVYYLNSNTYVSKNSDNRPAVVHRLDKDTTGVVVLAKDPNTHAQLSKQFHDRTTGRVYRALVLGSPRRSKIVQQEESGTINRKINRHSTKRTLMSVSDADGRDAVTHWERVENMDYAAILDIRLETGRTHQIRVHMDSVGSPVIGDKSYGNFASLPKGLLRVAEDFKRQALHAKFLSFDHPKTEERMEFSSDIPEDMQELIRVFRDY